MRRPRSIAWPLLDSEMMESIQHIREIGNEASLRKCRLIRVSSVDGRTGIGIENQLLSIGQASARGPFLHQCGPASQGRRAQRARPCLEMARAIALLQAARRRAAQTGRR